MLNILGALLRKVFGSSSSRYVKSSRQLVGGVASREAEYEGLSDEGLRSLTAGLKERIGHKKREVFRGRGLESLLAELQEVPEERRKKLKGQIIAGLSACAAEVLPEAFAAVREAAKRRLSMRHFDVQMIGGRVLHEGKIAEMATGEGKTLVATLPCYINVLLGLKVHVVSVNDYLVKRDRDWMAPVYEALGLSVGAIQSDMDMMSDVRKAQYRCDITYGTNTELGFDYLRDNMRVRRVDQVQGPLHYAIIDEVDSILIDGARTPLSISGPAHSDAENYKTADRVARVLIQHQQSAIRETQNRIRDLEPLRKRAGEVGIPDARVQEAAKKFAQDPTWLTEDEATALEHRLYYVVERDRKQAHMTHDGVPVAQQEAGVGSLYVGANMEWLHLIDNALRAHVVYERDKDYAVKDGQIVIVNEFTGRLMIGHQWSDGLHQAVEAREGVAIRQESQTLGMITIQNLFKLYTKLAGMTGTAATEAMEFMKTYGLEVVSIPTNRPVNRVDHNDRIYRTMKEKYDAVVEEIRAVSLQGFPDDPERIVKLLQALRAVHESDPAILERIDRALDAHGKDKKLWPALRDLLIELTPELPGGRPVLVGTVSIENSEKLSALLTQRHGIDHEVLNAKNHAREAEIVAKAGFRHEPRHGGRHSEGNVTIATNMAGHGTDIKLEKGVVYPTCIGPLIRENNVVATKCCIHCPEYDGQCQHCFKPKLDPRFPQMGRSFCRLEPPCGLHIVGTERHEARRIDKQLRGRSGRQGDPGSSRFLLSLEDELLRLFAGEWVIRMLEWAGMEEGMAFENKRISKGVERAQRKVEERHSSIRRNLLEYDEVMDYQRQVFYRLRQQILEGKDLDRMIWEMIARVVGEAVETFLDEIYPARCAAEWARGALGVNVSPEKLDMDSFEPLVQQIRDTADGQVQDTIKMTVIEYLDPKTDRQEWDYEGLAKWAMSRFNVSLSISTLSRQEPAAIEEALIQAALARIDQFDFSPLNRCLDPHYARSALADWAKVKFAFNVRLQDIVDLDAKAIDKYLVDQVQQAYHRREVEFPVDFALSNTLLAQEHAESAYGAAALVDWVNHKYSAGWTLANLQNKSLEQIRGEMVTLAQAYMDQGKLQEEIDQALDRHGAQVEALAQWSKTRFLAELDTPDPSRESLRGQLLAKGRSFLRAELTRLEQVLLLNVYDGAWKEHLLAMDHLRSAIGLRGYAECDPKVEYKREGMQMFHRMMDAARGQITDLILKARTPGSA